MDRGAWQATVRGDVRALQVLQDLVTKPPPPLATTTDLTQIYDLTVL